MDEGKKLNLMEQLLLNGYGIVTPCIQKVTVLKKSRFLVSNNVWEKK